MMERKVLEISLPKTGKKVKKHEKLSIHESDVQGEESRGEENQKKLKNQPKEQEKTSSNEFTLTSNEVKQLIEETLSKYLSSFSLQSTPHGPIPILSGGQLSFPLQTYYHQPPSQIPPPSQKKKIKNIKSSSSSQTPEISTDGPPPLSTIKSSEFINLKESFSLFQEEMKLKTIQYETNITSLKHVIDELQRSIIIKNDKWEDDFKKFQVSTEEKLHLSQQKMNKLIQKVYSKHETEVYDIRKELGELQEITSISNYNMKEDMHKLSKQISKSKEQLDSLISKVLDINLVVHQPPAPPVVPTVAPASYSMDANVSIDHLTQRLKTLEYRIGDLEAEDVSSYHDSTKLPTKSSKRKSRNLSISPSRSRHHSSLPSDDDDNEIVTPPTHSIYHQQQHQQRYQQQEQTIQFLTETLRELLHKLQKYKNNSNELTQTVKSQYHELSQQILELQSQNKNFHELIHQLESNQKKIFDRLITNEKKIHENYEKEMKKVVNDTDTDNDEIEFQLEKETEMMKTWNQQFHLLHKKVKLLTYNTNKVCKSLSIGISDAQYSILSIYSWAEKVHHTLEIISGEMNLESNLCPRLQLHNQRNINDDDMMMNIPTYFQGKHDDGKVERQEVVDMREETSEEEDN